MRLILAALAMTLVAALSACGAPPPGHSEASSVPYGITRDRAIELARAEAKPESQTPLTLIRAQRGRLGEFVRSGDWMPGEQRDVWAVSFHGSFPPPSCGPYSPIPHPCPSPQLTEDVILDAVSGAFIVGDAPAAANLGGPLEVCGPGKLVCLSVPCPPLPPIGPAGR